MDLNDTTVSQHNNKQGEVGRRGKPVRLGCVNAALFVLLQIVASGYDHLLHCFDLETFKPTFCLGMM